MKRAILRHPYLTLTVAAIGVHALATAAVITRYGRVDHFALQSLDAYEYYNLALNLLDRREFAQEPEALPSPWTGALRQSLDGTFPTSHQHTASPAAPDTWRTPGYPLFLALVMAVAGASVPVLVGCQQFISVACILLFFHLLQRWAGTERSLLASALLMIEPYRVHDSFWLLTTPLFVLVLLGAWWSWHEAIARRRRLWLMPCGFLIGAAVLVRPLAIALPFLLVPGVIRLFNGTRISAQIPAPLSTTGGSPGASLRVRSYSSRYCPWLAGAALSLSIAAPPVAWATRNYVVAGRFSLTHQGGIVLTYFKATEVELFRQGRTADRYLETTLNPGRIHEPHVIWDSIDQRLQERYAHVPDEDRITLNWRYLAQGNRTNFDSFEISDALTDIGVSMLAASPVHTLQTGLIGMGEILTFPLTLAIQPPNGVAVDRLRSGIIGAVYLAFTIGVMGRLMIRRFDWSTAYFPLVASFALLLTSTPQIDPRFRVPMMPFLIALWLLPIISKHRPTESAELPRTRDGAIQPKKSRW